MARMGPAEQEEIFQQLVRIDASLEDAEFTVQYERCYEVFNNLDEWRDYMLTEMVDAVTWERKWY